jgi:hypothetical protein
LFQFRNHWNCQTAKDCITDKERMLIERAMGEWKGNAKLEDRVKLSKNAEKVLKKLAANDTAERNGLN